MDPLWQYNTFKQILFRASSSSLLSNANLRIRHRDHGNGFQLTPSKGSSCDLATRRPAPVKVTPWTVSSCLVFHLFSTNYGPLLARSSARIIATQHILDKLQNASRKQVEPRLGKRAWGQEGTMRIRIWRPSLLAQTRLDPRSDHPDASHPYSW